MQIVRDLAGYTWGRSDLVRRAMSKKKQSVMEEERRNFVYGKPEENVPGCVANGIDEKVANKIYDEMIDFAKYAFNKSHAAAYAVVSYQTAYLKYYYPVEYMAALMTSVQDNTSKVSEYILTCRRMGIAILPPDINEGESGFSVSGKQIRYGLSAIRSVGRPVIEAILNERKKAGKFTSLKDFLTRMSGGEVNKRAVENFIKAGAMDGLEGTRKQKMMVYASILDSIHQDKKNVPDGQMSLFEMDTLSEEQKKEYEITMPDVGEYDKETMLGFEKEVLGIYVSGHPLEEYEERWRKNISATTADFLLDEEIGEAKIKDGTAVMVGGMITEKTIKYTKTNKVMAFLTIEDLLGTVEVVVFPRDYEKNQSLMQEDAKVFIRGRANVEEEKNGKVICEKVYPFDAARRELWIQFATKAEYEQNEQRLYQTIVDSDGNDAVIIYISTEKALKRLPASRNVHIDNSLLNNLTNIFGEKNVKVVEKAIENIK
ncbi:MAG: hypothetical protein J6A92_03035 [Lachnospiraceae bacterium]|nr:hypothetical protein [Lachnospiraceae bacterium]